MKINRKAAGLLALGVFQIPSLAATTSETNNVLLEIPVSSTLSGYVDTSAQWNFGSGNANNPLYSYGGARKADGFNLNAVELSLDKPLGETQDWNAGYKAELILGPDANGVGVGGLGTSSTGISSDFAIKQAYVTARLPFGNGIDFKLGVWDKIIGYEVFESDSNPNFTRSYGYTIEPTTHTGVQLAYKFCDYFALTAGVAETFGPTINQRASPIPGGVGFYEDNSYLTYMGALSLKAPEKWGWIGGSSLNAGIINGFNSTSPATANSGQNFGHADQTSYYVGASINSPLEALKFGVAYDYVDVGNEPNLHVTRAYATAVSLYGTYQINDRFKLSARTEYFAQSKSPNLPGGLPSKVFAATLTTEYDLWKNVISRVEFRWDHQADGTGEFYGDTSNGAVIGGGSVRNAYELIGSLVYKF